ncbi:hypothetical protein BM1_06688 [Bipolaris maydis]|nr:hypothetical protein BM1_06688 [Bipolaris maydis]
MNRYIASLQRQVRELHATVEDLKTSPFQAPPQRVSGSPSTRDAQREEIPVHAIVDVEGPSPVSAMGAVATSQRGPFGDEEFYGQSSVHSLLQEVPHGDHRRGPLGATSMPWRYNGNLMIQAHYALPPRNIADRLIDRFFQNVHIFYPWCHSVSFRARYESLWTKEGYPEPSVLLHRDIGLGGDRCPPSAFFCALNAMFALGCEFSAGLPNKQSVCATFGDRMNDLMHVDLLDQAGLGQVQALLLVSHWLLTTELPTRCYNVVGLACRMAVGIGLNSNRHAGRRSCAENEIRRRVWFGCLQMEIFVSRPHGESLIVKVDDKDVSIYNLRIANAETVCMTLGRRPLLQVTDDVPLPTAVDDEFLDVHGDTCQQPDGVPSHNLFTVENIKLAKLLGTILDTVYFSDSRTTSTGQAHTANAHTLPDIGTLIRLDNLLEDFKSNLPEQLNWDRDPERHQQVDYIYSRQTNVLHARFLHLRILLYRPTFSSFVASNFLNRREQDLSRVHGLLRAKGHALNAGLLDQCAKTCVQTASELATVIENAIVAGTAGAWWFSLFYLITCGGICILAEGAKVGASPFEQDQLDNMWQSCVRSLQHIGRDHGRVQSNLEHLCSLRERARAHSTDPSGRPTRLPSRRPSYERPALDDSNGMLADFNLTGEMNDVFDTDSTAFSIFDHWDWSSEMPTYGGFGLSEEFLFPVDMGPRHSTLP